MDQNRNSPDSTLPEKSGNSDKQKRLASILEIIREHEIETQDQLIEKLKERGFKVTQATISRDIRELRLIKIATDSGHLCYALNPQNSDSHSPVRYGSILTETVHSVEVAQNLVVLKTHSGMANAAAAAIEAMGFSEIVGCIAGDDTILVVLRSDEEAKIFSEKIRRQVP